MIIKTINSYDIQINGQLLRVVEHQELQVDAPPFNSKKLLLNEPRGNKYINLVTYKEEDEYLKVTLDSPGVITNKEILLKSFIKSLIDRKRIQERNVYTLVLDGEELSYKNEELSSSELLKVNGNEGVYSVHNKSLGIAETDLTLDVNNMTSIKSLISCIEGDFDYLILLNKNRFVIVDEESSIIPYPIIEVISLLNEKYKGEQFTTLTGNDVEIKNNKFNYGYCLVSNSQFYIDDTDIYEEGFIIK